MRRAYGDRCSSRRRRISQQLPHGNFALFNRLTIQSMKGEEREQGSTIEAVLEGGGEKV